MIPTDKLTDLIPTDRWKRLAVPLAGLAASAAIALVLPYLVKLFVDVAVPGKDISLLWTLGAVGVVVYAGSSLGRYYGRMATARLAEDVRRELVARLFSHVQGLSLEFHRSRDIGDLVSRIQYDTFAVRGFLAATIPAVIDMVVTIGGTAVVLCVLEPRLVVLAFAALPAAAVIAYLFRDKVRPLSRKLSQRYGQVYSTVHESLTAVEAIKVYDGVDTFEGRLGEQIDQQRRVELELARHQNKLFPLLNFAISLVLLAVLVAGGYMAIAGTITVGTVVAYYYYISKSLGPVRSASSLVLGWQRASAAVERLDALLGADERLDRADPAADMPGDTMLGDTMLGDTMPGEKATGDAAGLVLDDVSFSYRDPDTGDTFRAVDGLDLRLDPGRRVAIVGPSGSGKSTLGKMIPRLFDPDHGRLRVGGTPVDQLDLQVWRRRVGYVGQNVCLFAGTIDDNVRFGLDPADISADQLDRVVHIARVDLVAADKPGGLDTRVGEGGQKLSGGQKKRIALARALIRRPAVLVIDQLAADLEAELCRAIFEAIRHAYPTMSILHVGHRVPVGFEPDEVFWMEHGRIQPRSSVVDDDRPVSPTPECTSGQPPNP